MLWLTLRLLFDVRLATLVGAALAGDPELGPVLVDVARRESSLQLVGVHRRDARHSEAARPNGCPRGRVYSSRGAHGQFAAYALQYGPDVFRCSTRLVDIPLVSAYLGTIRAKHWRCRAVKRCRSWLAVAS